MAHGKLINIWEKKYHPSITVVLTKQSSNTIEVRIIRLLSMDESSKSYD